MEWTIGPESLMSRRAMLSPQDERRIPDPESNGPRTECPRPTGASHQDCAKELDGECPEAPTERVPVATDLAPRNDTGGEAKSFQGLLQAVLGSGRSARHLLQPHLRKRVRPTNLQRTQHFPLILPFEVSGCLLHESWYHVLSHLRRQRGGCHGARKSPR